MRFFLLPVCCWLLSIPLMAQLADTSNMPGFTTSRNRIPEGPGVAGVFNGRSPCEIIATVLRRPVSPTCLKVKLRLTLYCDSVTGQPTTYQFHGREGRWTIIKGMKNNPHAIVYQLSPEQPQETMFILKGDDHVLFILNQDKDFMTGNELYSYTLNRVVNKVK